tara:strand:+ start:234 stop:1940 length:1707 start_codon:yes stop_codon:yes gene_type:complete
MTYPSTENCQNADPCCVDSDYKPVEGTCNGEGIQTFRLDDAYCEKTNLLGDESFVSPEEVTRPCDVNCVLDDWVDSGTCSSEGTQEQTRSIITEPLNDGNPCDIVRRFRPCNVNAVCGWVDSGTCSSEGNQEQTRTTITSAINSGTTCGSDNRFVDCRVNCDQTEWTDVGGCVSDGKKKQERTTNSGPLYAGEVCGPLEQFVECSFGNFDRFDNDKFYIKGKNGIYLGLGPEISTAIDARMSYLRTVYGDERLTANKVYFTLDGTLNNVSMKAGQLGYCSRFGSCDYTKGYYNTNWTFEKQSGGGYKIIPNNNPQSERLTINNVNKVDIVGIESTSGGSTIRRDLEAGWDDIFYLEKIPDENQEEPPSTVEPDVEPEDDASPIIDVLAPTPIYRKVENTRIRVPLFNLNPTEFGKTSINASDGSFVTINGRASHELTEVDKGGVDACMETCNSFDLCEGFVHERSTDKCFLKSGHAKQLEDHGIDGYDMYYKSTAAEIAAFQEDPPVLTPAAPLPTYVSSSPARELKDPAPATAPAPASTIHQPGSVGWMRERGMDPYAETQTSRGWW